MRAGRQPAREPAMPECGQVDFCCSGREMVSNDVVVVLSRHRLPTTSQVRAPGTVDRAEPSRLNGSAKSCVPASNVTFRPPFAVRCASVNSSPAPVGPLVSSLQLTLNLHNFRYIFRRERDLAGEDYKQHVDERVSRNVRHFSEQVAPPGGANRISDIHTAIRGPRVGVKAVSYTHLTLPTKRIV